MIEQKILELALEQGFTHTAPLDPGTLELLPEVRDMCAENSCGKYDKNWACPPACGTLEECREKSLHTKREFSSRPWESLRTAWTLRQ